jgi:hypothetical protein
MNLDAAFASVSDRFVSFARGTTCVNLACAIMLKSTQGKKPEQSFWSSRVLVNVRQVIDFRTWSSVWAAGTTTSATSTAFMHPATYRSVEHP